MLRKTLATVAVAAALVAGTSSGAHATRPIVGYDYPDVCKNIKGEQTILEVVGISAQYQFVTSTRRPNDCKLNPLRRRWAW